MPKLVALERFYYNGRNVEMGEQFDAEEVDIPLLIHVHTPKAKLEERGEPEPEAKLGRTAKPEPETQGERRAYKRRDMKAED